MFSIRAMAVASVITALVYQLLPNEAARRIYGTGEMDKQGKVHAQPKGPGTIAELIQQNLSPTEAKQRPNGTLKSSDSHQNSANVSMTDEVQPVANTTKKEVEVIASTEAANFEVLPSHRSSTLPTQKDGVTQGAYEAMSTRTNMEAQVLERMSTTGSLQKNSTEDLSFFSMVDNLFKGHQYRSITSAIQTVVLFTGRSPGGSSGMDFEIWASIIIVAVLGGVGCIATLMAGCTNCRNSFSRPRTA